VITLIITILLYGMKKKHVNENTKQIEVNFETENKVKSTSANNTVTSPTLPESKQIISDDLKKIVLNISSANQFGFQRSRNEQFELIAKDKELTIKLIQLFGSFDKLKILFGEEQAIARVKLLDFFEYVKNDYSNEILNELKNIQIEHAFLKKTQGRDFDYRDLARIYFSSFSEDYLRNNLIFELKNINYHTRDNWIIAYAIAHSHPNLLKDRKFTLNTKKLLEEGTI